MGAETAMLQRRTPTCSGARSELPESPLDEVLLTFVVMFSSCCITAFAIAVAAAVVGAEVAPFWTGEATIGGARTSAGIGVPENKVEESIHMLHLIYIDRCLIEHAQQGRQF